MVSLGKSSTSMVCINEYKWFVAGKIIELNLLNGSKFGGMSIAMFDDRSVAWKRS